MIPKRRESVLNRIVGLNGWGCPWRRLGVAVVLRQQDQGPLARQFVSRAGFGSKAPDQPPAYGRCDRCTDCASHLGNGFSIRDDN